MQPSEIKDLFMSQVYPHIRDAASATEKKILELTGNAYTAWLTSVQTRDDMVREAARAKTDEERRAFVAKYNFPDDAVWDGTED